MEEAADYAIKDEQAEECAMEQYGTGCRGGNWIPSPFDEQHVFPVVRWLRGTFKQTLHG
jgi:hypothetical protein